MPRFVVQQHFRARDDYHFDLMLEAGETLLTFQCGVPPDRTKELPCLVVQLPDHRLDYLWYQGEIRRGRGWCEIYDRGTFEWVEPAGGSPVHAASEMRVRLAGRKARGLYALRRAPESGRDYWRLRWDGPGEGEGPAGPDCGAG